MKNKKYLVLILVVISVVLVALGVTFASFTFSGVGQTENKIKTGTVTMVYTEGENKIAITNAMPIEDSEGKLLTNNDQVFDFTVDINTTQAIAYEVTAVKDDNSTLENTDVRLYLERSLDGTKYEEVLAPSNYTPTKEDDKFGAKKGEMILDTGTVSENTSYKYRLRMWLSKDYEITSESKSFTVRVNVYGKEGNSIKKPVSFATDDWKTIIGNVKIGNTDTYKLGDTKEIDMGTLGTHTVRISNKSTPDECKIEGFSQTACGFVIEFADIITTHNMNSDGTNKGGWPASSMRAYINDTIIPAMPEEVQKGMLDTYTVSGHGSTSGELNFESIDKMYLLSSHEVWSNDTTFDTAYDSTRQLDYYKNNNVDSSNAATKSLAIKKNSGKAGYWWLRPAFSSEAVSFLRVNEDGYWSAVDTRNTYGVSPAFRIG